MKASPQQSEKTFDLKRRSGRIGSTARDSTRTKSPSTATPPTSRPMICHEPQGYVEPPKLVASTSMEAPIATVAMPR